MVSILNMCYFLTGLLILDLVRSQRIIHPESQLSKFVSNNLDEYWNNMTMIFERRASERWNGVLNRWKEVVRRDDLQNRINAECMNIIEYMITNPVQHEWIIKIIDSGIMELPSGILSGTTTHLGDFDQCLSIRDSHNQHEFVGKYCLATLNLPRTDQFVHPISLNDTQLSHPWMADYIQKWYQNDNFYAMASSICFPSICDRKDIRQLLLSYFDFLNSFEFDVQYCQSNDDVHEYSFGQIVSLIILFLPWIAIIPATLFDALTDQVNNVSITYRILLSFSLIRNNRHLFQIRTAEPSSNRREFQFIHGIRAICAIFIIMAHSGALVFVMLFMRVSVMARHPFDSVKLSKLLFTQPFYNGSLIVMTFFVISGFICTYLNASEDKLKISFIPYLLLRWIRLVVPLIATICMNISLELIGDGPLFHHDLLWPTLKPCYENWWYHVLGISNYIGYEQMCNIQTWFISADLQVHIVSYLILIFYARNRKFALLMCIILIVIGMIGIIAPVITQLTDLVLLQTIVYTKFPPRGDVGIFVVFSVFMQMISYFAGALIGIMILEKRQLKLSKFKETLLWTLSTLFLISIPFSSYPFAGDESNIKGDSSLLNALNFATMVLIWSLCNAWFIYQCSIKPNLFICRLLSANFFKPLSRLSFCLYLSHLMTIWFMAHQTRSPISLVNFIDLFKILSITLVSSFLFAYYLHLTFEAPIIGILSILFKNRMSNKPTSRENNQTGKLKGHEMISMD